MPESEFEHDQEDAAAAEAGAIGGRPRPAGYEQDGEPADPAQEPLIEAGEGESEGFEQAEADLIDHAAHGDQHAAGRVLEDAPEPEAEHGEDAAPGDEEQLED